MDTCPYCNEEIIDGEVFMCNECGTEICDDCAFHGMCEECVDDQADRDDG